MEHRLQIKRAEDAAIKEHQRVEDEKKAREEEEAERLRKEQLKQQQMVYAEEWKKDIELKNQTQLLEEISEESIVDYRTVSEI